MADDKEKTVKTAYVKVRIGDIEALVYDEKGETLGQVKKIAMNAFNELVDSASKKGKLPLR